MCAKSFATPAARAASHERSQGPFPSLLRGKLLLVRGRSSRRVIVHDRGIWKLGEYLCGKTAGYVHALIRDRRQLKANQRFAFGTKQAAPVGLEQKGFAGAEDIIKVLK